MLHKKIIPIIALVVITGLRLEGQNPDSVCCPVPVPVHITNVVPATCEECNGEATAETNGCSQYNSYEWSNGQNGQTATQLCAGETYTVTITDCFGCTGVNSVTIPNGGGKIPNVWAGVNPNIICVGECALWYAGAVNGTPPYTYEWSPNGKTTPTFYECGYQGNTEYEVTVTGADGCSNTASALLIVSKPTKKITASICAGQNYQYGMYMNYIVYAARGWKKRPVFFDSFIAILVLFASNLVYDPTCCLDL